MLKHKSKDYSPEKSCDSQVIKDALKALREIQEEAKRNGTSEMTLEEINAKIAAARREREARQARQA